MNEIELLNLCHRLFIYDPETGRLVRKITVAHNAIAGDIAGNIERGYVSVGINYKKYRAHRIIWLMQTGMFPRRLINHINDCRSDNRWANLREVSMSETVCNRGRIKSNKTGLKGVVFKKANIHNPYVSRITIKGEINYLGSFPSPEQAYKAYCKASKRLHGKFGRVA